MKKFFVNTIAKLHFACDWIIFKKLGTFGQVFGHT